jgi:putative ABC transport system permease protein
MRSPSALTRKAIADITRRKSRTVLVILGILIGVLGLTAVNLADDLMGNAFSFRYNLSTLPDLAYNTQSQAIDASLLSGVQRMANVAQASLRTEYDTRWHISSGSGYAHLSILGNIATSPNALGAFQLTSGHLPGPGEIVMESSDSTVQPFSLGDTITIDSSGGTATLHIVGMARTPGNLYQQNGLAYMRPDVLQHLAHLSGPNDLLVKLGTVNQQTLQQANTAIVHYLHDHGLQRVGVSGQTIASSTQVIVNGVFAVIRVVSLIALLLACFLMINTVSTLLTEQIPIIGTMKALGGQRGTIMRGYLISMSIYACVGTMFGIALGSVSGAVLAQNFAASLALNLGPFTLSPWVIAVSLVVGLALPLLSALLPLAHGTSITVRQAMATYGVHTGQHPRTIGRNLSWVPQTVLLGLRGVFRKPIRASLTLLALVFCTAVFLSVQTTTVSISATLNEVEQTYSSDVTISLNPQPYQPLFHVLSQIPNVERIEPRESQTIQLLQSNQSKLDLVGLDPDTQLYQRHLVSGRWLARNEAHTLVLSDLAAGSLGLRVGDTLSFRINQKQVEHWAIVGIVHDLNKDLGNTLGVAYTNIQVLNALDHAPATLHSDLTVSDLMVRARDRSPAAVNTLAKDFYAALAHNGTRLQVTTAQQSIQQNQGPAQLIYAMFDLVAVIVALVGILGLFSTLSSSVLERRLEIGILRSLGASGWHVASVFLMEGLAFAVLACLIGTALGIPLAYGLVALLSEQIVPLDFLFDPLAIVVTLLFVLLVVALACMGPAFTASRLRIRELLRYE